MDGDLADSSRIFPKKTSEKVAFLVTLSGIPMVFLFELVFIFPQYFAYFSPAFWFHLAGSLFVAQNILSNLYYMLTVDASGRSSKLPHILYPGWKYCYICKLNAPPRSYHCHVCNECILKQDHHSLFAGKCVGYHNQRYYVMMVVYLWVGALYAIWFHAGYCWSVLSSDGAQPLACVLRVFFPQIAFLLRFISTWQFIAALVLMTSLYGLVISTYLALYQFVLIWRGQSHHEMREGIRRYDMGPLRNIRDVFGARWVWATWISALLPSPLDGDGLKFNEGGGGGGLGSSSGIKRL